MLIFRVICSCQAKYTLLWKKSEVQSTAQGWTLSQSSKRISGCRDRESGQLPGARVLWDLERLEGWWYSKNHPLVKITYLTSQTPLSSKVKQSVYPPLWLQVLCNMTSARSPLIFQNCFFFKKKKHYYIRYKYSLPLLWCLATLSLLIFEKCSLCDRLYYLSSILSFLPILAMFVWV